MAKGLLGRAVEGLLGRPWWQGVGALVGVLGIVASFAIAVAYGPEAAPAPTPSAPAQNQQISGDGNCVAQGVGNSVVCPAAPVRSFGNIQLGSQRLEHVFFNGPPNRLPRPPDYPRSDFFDHCAEWREWFDNDRRIYTSGSRFLLRMTAGTDDLVVVTDVYAKIFKKTPATPGTSVQCSYGGDSDEGMYISVDTFARETTFYRSTVLGAGARTPMPPGSLTMGLGDSGHSVARIDLRSEDGYLYEGQLVVEALVNNEPETLRWGTPTQPFRWLSDPSGRFWPDLGEHYDWHPVKKRWIQGLNPENIDQ